MRKEFWKWMILLRIVIPIIAIAQPSRAQPDAPSNVNAVAGNYSATISWEVTGETHPAMVFDLYYSLGSEEMKKANLEGYERISDIAFTSSSMSYEVFPLLAGQPYSFALIARFTHGPNPRSSPLSETAFATPLPLPVPPEITAQPQNQAVTAPATATFSVTVTGSTSAYRWHKNGVAISGSEAAHSSYTTPPTSLADNGALFSVVVTNAAGKDSSQAATLTVSEAQTLPSITTQPVGQTVNAGATATFSVVATGNPSPNYQWYKDDAPVGSNSPSYTTPATTASDNGAKIRVAVSNSVGTVNSNTVTLTVNVPNQPPTANAGPDQTITLPDSVSLSGSGNDPDPGTVLTYVWSKVSGPGNVTFSNPNAAITKAGFSLSGVYILKLTVNDGSATASDEVTITVNNPANQPPTISWLAPANNATFTTPVNITLSVSAGDVDGTVSKVSFFRGNTKLGDVNPPLSGSTYTYVWNNVPAGSYTLKAVAYDNKGDSTTTPTRSIIVNDPANIPPQVSITKPANNAQFVAPAQINLEANASDPDGNVTTVQYFHGGSNSIGQATTGPYAVTWNSVAAGTYSLTARATDNRGGSANSPAITISVTLPAPSGVAATPGNTSATISWNAVPGATSYNLFYNPGASINSSPTALTNIQGTSYTVTGLTNGQQYAFALSTVGPGGISPRSGAVTATPNQPKVATPLANPAGRSYTEPLTIELTTNTPNAVIRYTLDNTTPTGQSPAYDPVNKIKLDKLSAVLKARAFRTDYRNSDIRTETYTYVEPGRVLSPLAQPADSTFTGSLTVTLTTATSGSEIHYTLDGATPTVSSPKYAGPFQISRTTTIKAIAVKEGMLPSPVLVKTYNLQVPSVRAQKPIADPPGLEFTNSVSIRLSTQTSGAEILFALDDSTAQAGNWPVYTPGSSIILNKSTRLRALTRRGDLLLSDTLTEVYTQLPTTPTSTPAGDSIFAESLEVALHTSPAGASIHYTLDGSNPLTEGRQPAPTSLLFTSGTPVLITSSGVLKAASFLNGKASKGTLTNFYLKEGEPLPSPAANPSASAFSDSLSVRLLSAYESKIFYTLDGSIPTASSPEFKGEPLKLTKSVILQAIAVKPGFPNSKIMVERFTFIPHAPTATPAGGNYVEKVTVKLASKTPDARILYTTDGRSPLAGDAQIYDSSVGIPLTSSATLMAYASLGGQASEVITENYVLTGSNDTLLAPGGTVYLPGGYSLASPTEAAMPLTVRVIGGETVPVAGFSDRLFGLRIESTDTSEAFPHLGFFGPRGTEHALYRLDADGRVYFIARSDSGLITEPGQYVLAIDIVPPRIVLMEQSFDTADSTRIRMQILDNVSNLVYDIKRNDDTLAQLEYMPVLHQEVLEFKFKHAAGEFKPLLFQLMVSDHKNQGYFPKNPTARYGLPQKLRSVKSPAVLNIAQPGAESEWELMGFPFPSNPPLTTAKLQDNHPGTRFSSAGWNFKVGSRDGMLLGQAYWINASKPVNFLQFNDLETGAYSTDSLSVQLVPGWNAISSPYIEKRYWPHSRQFPEQYGSSVIKGLFAWDPLTRSYTPTDSLEPWKGYFVYSYDSSLTKVELLARRPEKPILLKKETSGQRLEIQVQLEKETPVWLGAASFAGDGLGVEDEFTLPNRSGAAAAWASRNSTSLQSDWVRFQADGLMKWQVILSAKSTGDSLPTLRVTHARLPEGFEAWAFSRSRNMKFPLASGSGVGLSGLPLDTLDIVAGPTAKMAKLGGGHGITRFDEIHLGVMPLEGDFQVRLQIPGISRVRLTVWNLQGSRLGEINPGRLAEGNYRFTYSNDFKRIGQARLASGMYFLMAEISGTGESHRLVKRLPIR